MQITQLSPGLNQINTQSDVGTKVLAKALENNDEQGKAMIDALNKSVANQTGIGKTIDVSV